MDNSDMIDKLLDALGDLEHDVSKVTVAAEEISVELEAFIENFGDIEDLENGLKIYADPENWSGRVFLPMMAIERAAEPFELAQKLLDKLNAHKKKQK